MKKIFFILLIAFTFTLWSEEFSVPSHRDISLEEIYKLNNRDIELDEIVYYEWSNLSWRSILKDCYSYNEDGNVSEMISYQFYQPHWGKYYKQVYSYYSDGDIIEIHTYYWQGGAWQNVYHLIYEYENAKISYYKQALWNDYSNLYEDEIQHIYFYNGDILEEKLTQNFTSTQWVNQYINVYSYDYDDLLTEDLSFAWTMNNWVEDTRILYIYDEISKPSEMIFQYAYFEEWENNFKHIYNYNSTEEIENVLLIIWQDEWVNSTDTYYQYNEIEDISETIQNSWNGEWAPTLRAVYNYIELDIEDNMILDFNEIISYPNPCFSNTNSNIYFSLDQHNFDKLEIFNCKGEKIRSLDINNNQAQWDLLDKNGKLVSAGIYLVIQKLSNRIIGKKRILLLK